MNKIWKRQRHVAQILYSGLGGHGGVVFSMIDADMRRRWRHSLAFLGIEPLLPTYADRCSDEQIDYQYIHAISGRPWRNYRPVYRWLRRTRPEIVLLHSLSALPPVWLYARTRGLPLIVVEHQPNELKTRQERLFSWLAMRVADAIVLLTPRYRMELATALGRGFRPNKVRIIANGINTAAFKTAHTAAKRPSNTIRIGMAARFSRTKRFDLMLDMLKVLRSRAPDIEWQLSLAGSGETWTEFRRLAESSNFGSSLAFEGLLSGTPLIDWYRNLDIYCHASDGETLSMSVLQAMAAGLPIVGSDVEGINNLLAGEAAVGRIVHHQTGEAFADAVEAMAADREKALTMGLRAQQVAEELYSNSAMFEAYADLVDSLLA